MQKMAVMLLVACLTAACTSGGSTPGTKASESTSDSSGVITPSSGPPSTGGDTDARTVPEWLVPVDLRPRVPYFGIRLTRAADGSTVVFFGVSFYRIYGPRWRPRTPLLQLPHGWVEVTRGLRHSFLGWAARTRRGDPVGDYRMVTLQADGTFRPVTEDLNQAKQTQRGDVLSYSPIAPTNGVLAYRPSQRRVFAPALPWPRGGYWPVEPGSACGATRDRNGTTLWWSTDEARTWQSARIPARRSDRDEYACWVRGRRVSWLAEPGHRPGHVPLVHVLHTTTTSRPTAATSFRLPQRFDPYGHDVLPDGRWVFGTSPPGLMVATDATNTHFEFRPGPFPPLGGPIPPGAPPRPPGGESHEPTFVVLGKDIVQIPPHLPQTTIHVSGDAGRTWEAVHLKTGGSTASR